MHERVWHSPDQSLGEEAATQQNLVSRVKQLGSIVAKFYWVEFEPATPPHRNTGAERDAHSTLSNNMAHDQVQRQALENDEVTEKALKGQAISHQAK